MDKSRKHKALESTWRSQFTYAAYSVKGDNREFYTNRKKQAVTYFKRLL